MGRMAQVAWRGKTEEGEPREVYAEKVREEWRFYTRSRRYDDWERLADPTLEDWLTLLDGVRRRIPRRLYKPEEEGKLVAMIQERFPDADIDAEPREGEDDDDE